MLVASVLSLKGGVGKTTVTLGLASAAHHRGIDTLLIDLDPQMNATSTLTARDDLVAVLDGTRPPGGHHAQSAGDPDKDSHRPRVGSTTITEVLDDPRRKVVARAVQPSGWGGSLRILPGSETVEAHNHPDPDAKRLVRLTDALALVDPAPELVLIDCPPSLGQLTRSGLVAADRAVLVTEPSLYSVTGVQRALEAVQQERSGHNPRLQPLGVVINRFRPRVAEHEYRLQELQDLFGPLVLSPVLADRSAVQQAQGAGMPIHGWPTPGARQLAQQFDELLDRLLRSARRRSR
ncbi:ParA family protein [Nakamurella leprariae]|uniref:ParA family protein n=1 Tax=Nakamurella leprariae TaxID=2803911 RepID=A0A938YK29_9ACTN|nr:ParA family protein [Nakamurella leprariae]MBM9469235.1 ParA family protein [Nakamurella leprariae]